VTPSETSPVATESSTNQTASVENKIEEAKVEDPVTDKIEAKIEDKAEDELSHATMKQLLDEYSGEAAPATGEIKQVTVVNITTDGIMIDLGLKREGMVPLSEFTDDTGTVTVQVGDTFEVLVEASHDRQDYTPCSSEGAYRLRLWEQIETAYREKTTVRCRATGRIKGGLEIDILLPNSDGRRRPLSGFMPGSQVDLRPVRRWEGFLNREFDAHILRHSQRRGNIVLSRRTLLEEEVAARKKLLEEILIVGSVVKGTVKTMTDYGAFVDLGGFDGLLHITDISYRRLSHPSDALSLEEEITVKILKVDKKKGRVSLGIKQLEPDPWENIVEKYKVGERLRGRVTHMLDYGAFVEIEPGVEGLIHVSELSWTKKIRHPSQVLNDGDGVEVAVLDILPKEKRISLGLRQTQPDPFQEVARRFPPGSVVEGKVSTLTDFGAFIELEPGVEGMVHLSELSWNKKAKKPAKVLQPGQVLKTKVLKVDILNRRLSLSLKDLTPDPFATFVNQNRMNAIVKGKVSRRTDFGVFVELIDGVEGLCHISELPQEKDEIRVGEEHEFKIVKLNLNERRIGLSIKAMRAENDRRALKEYRSSQPRSTATLAEILKSKGITSAEK